MSKNLYGNGLLGPLQPRDRGTLCSKFTFPPFSVWNTRDGFWQDRKRRWLNLGIESELGRDGALTFQLDAIKNYGGFDKLSQTSIFDPVVCELAYTWWCRKGGQVLDPFAGGSVRGIMASVLGYKYWGSELRPEQVNANQVQIYNEVGEANTKTTGKHLPEWVCGDSYDTVKKAPDADFIFSCPPYGALEKYSDDPKDLSNMTYEEFDDRYSKIIKRSCKRLKNNSFACFVVATFREKGILHDFTGHTIRAFESAGLQYYNDIILVNCVGTGGVRSNSIFIRGNQKVVKLHQNVLVFVKGDPALAAKGINPYKEVKKKKKKKRGLKK